MIGQGLILHELNGSYPNAFVSHEDVPQAEDKRYLSVLRIFLHFLQNRKF
jgi:hypothetical protein